MSVPIPISEPSWLMGLPSPYYHESHRKFQKAAREFINASLHENALTYQRDGEVPAAVFRKFAEANLLVPNMPAPLPVDWLRKVGLGKIGGGIDGDTSKGFADTTGVVDVGDWDYMHVLIYTYEMNRSGLNGPAMSISAGHSFAIAPLFKFGNKQVQERFLPDLLTGRKRTCLAVTEPSAGSDIANIQTTATKSDDGKHYIVDGSKKWITNGIWSDYATMAVRTGDRGPNGISLLVVPLKGQQGVQMRKMDTGASTSGTTFIDLDEVQVPVENLVGEEGRGMKYIMTNFNHERLLIAITAGTQARAVLSAAISYVMKREAFGNRLIDQPVVRHRLAKATAEIEPLWAWIEQFVYQMIHLEKEIADIELGGLTALAKAKAGIVFNECAQCAVLLFGGNGLTATGQGELAHRVNAEVMASRIPGGAEDVLLDLSIRQLIKNYERKSKKLDRDGSKL